MRKKFIYICSPCRGDYEKNIQNARNYCREVMTKWSDVVPIAPHVFFTQFLDDTIPTERTLGMNAGIALLDMCDEIWVYGPHSEGMKAEIEYAKEHGIPIRDGIKMHAYTIGKDIDLPEEELGDALLVLPSYVGSINGVAAIESTTVRISGEAIMDLERALRHNRGSDITVEAAQ